MPTRDQYLELWGEDNTVAPPVSEWKSSFAAPAGAWPEVDLLPIDMSVAFTAYIEGEYKLFDQFEVRYEEEGDSQTFIIIGKQPETATNFFALDPDTGAVHLMDPEDMTLEQVNASFAVFVQFLYRFAQFVEADEGEATRPAKAEVLEGELRALDPSAFGDRESYWPMLMMLLKGEL
ncbi:SUKH-4 family immunity protein [Glycomyces sp. NPDC047369]